METIAGSGDEILQFGGAPRQIGISNLDGSNGMNVKVNGDPVGQSIEPSGKRGWRVNKGIYDVTITATGNWEVTRQ
jgi:hypothetical protein